MSDTPNESGPEQNTEPSEPVEAGPDQSEAAEPVDSTAKYFEGKAPGGKIGE